MQMKRTRNARRPEVTLRSRVSAIVETPLQEDAARSRSRGASRARSENLKWAVMVRHGSEPYFGVTGDLKTKTASRPAISHRRASLTTGPNNQISIDSAARLAIARRGAVLHRFQKPGLVTSITAGSDRPLRPAQERGETYSWR